MSFFQYKKRANVSKIYLCIGNHGIMSKLLTLAEQTSAIRESSLSPVGSTNEKLCEQKSFSESQQQNVTDCFIGDDIEILTRPILVGYAFGPKKMSTMGVVMAEASKTHLSSVATTVLVEGIDEEDEAGEDDQDIVEDEGRKFSLVCGNDEDNDQSADQQQHDREESQPFRDDSHTHHPSSTSRRNSSDNNGNILLSLDSYSGGLKNIVRYLHSSCSSVDTNSTTTTLLTTGTNFTGVTPSSASTCCRLGGASISSGRSSSSRQQRLRVSFVPLDPDLPLEGQHGAKMDIILHKLTEDILCLSKFSPKYPNLVPKLGGLDVPLKHLLENLEPELPEDAKGAIMRVHRLMQYQKKNPDCSLADDPAKVLTLMSRSDIAHTLANCLVGVTSSSGIPVSSPKFVVWNPDMADSSEKDRSVDLIAQRLRKANMTYPLIAKPLQAAGTKISHHMTVLLQESSLDHIQMSSCLLQEYANHDGVLYKVYVLGNNVHVYQRPSLPNLPSLYRDGVSEPHGPSYVDFDSQRPYPRLSAFGVEDDSKRKPLPYLSALSLATSNKTKNSTVAVTAEEVQPIVDTLKKAFGLELFGFDILITSEKDSNNYGPESDLAEKKHMLVVDVNYFPSYKEVSNFPSLLAQYLTQRAIDSRRNPTSERSDES